MGEIADDLIELGIGQYLDALGRGEKRINPFWDTWLWRDSNEIVRHFEAMDSFHLRKTEEFLENQSGQKNKRQRMERITHIKAVLKRRDYTDEQYEFDKVGVTYGLRCDPYDGEVVIESGEFMLGSGIDNWHKWWETHKYILEQPFVFDY